jgi:hypothetical protein
MQQADRSKLPRTVQSDAIERPDEDDETDEVALFRLRVTSPTGSVNQDGVVPVSLQRTSAVPTSDQILWMLIRNRTDAISFPKYKQFIDGVMCGNTKVNGTSGETLQYRGTGAYELLCKATDAFLMQEMGVIADTVVAGQASRAGAGADDGPGWVDLDGLTPEQLALREGGRLGFRPSKQQISDMREEYFQQLQGELGVLPYLKIIQERLSEIPLKGPNEVPPNCYGILRSRLSEPLSIELIWSYWHEEGMLVQTMNAISRRFQNVRSPGDRDPLAHLEIDPLRPLNNLLWGYIQDEQNLLTVKRRAYEYDHHYGLATYGKAVPPLRPADSRSKFLEGFHNLLHLASLFYKEDNDTTVIADGFPLLNALREVHLLLAQGAHNQFGDLPWTARAEMLMQQWLLAQPQMREFLQSRPMVPYKEPWMGQVDTMKSLQGWSDVTVTHFRDLGAYGEQILLSIRYGDWIDINEEDSAKNWARYWRPEIQSYIHAYRIVTGIDLSNPDTVDYTMPAVHLQKRLALQRAR